MDRAFPSWIALDCPSSPRRRAIVQARSPSSSLTLLSSSPRSPARSRRRVWPQQHGAKPPCQHPLSRQPQQPPQPQQQQQPLGGVQEECVPPNTSVPISGNTLSSSNQNNNALKNSTDWEGLASVVVHFPETMQQHADETSICCVWRAELEWERKYLLKLCQGNGTETDAFDLRYVADRIRTFPESLQPVPMSSSKGRELLLQDCRFNTDMTNENNNLNNSWGENHLSSLHQETRKRRILRLREEQQQEQLHSPPPLLRSNTRSTTSDPFVLYEPTVLGALCSVNMSVRPRRDDSPPTATTTGDDDDSIIHRSQDGCVVPSVVELIGAVLQMRPEQVRCNQRRMGHTPLRDAVCNPTCVPIVLELLVQADHAVLLSLEQQQQRDNNTTTDKSVVLTTFQPPATAPSSSVVHWPDQDGITPLDHLLHAVQLGPQSEGAVARLQSLVKHASPVVGAAGGSDVAPQRPPLLYLLSLGTSFRVLPCVAAVAPVVSPYTLLLSDGGCERQDPTLRLHRILDCTRLLLQWDSSLLLDKSQSTGCTPLHVAIRNYGNFAPLIRELIERDVDCSLLRHRNCFGDLPLHVACSVGVPMDIMRLVLARSLISSSSSPSSMSGGVGGANVAITEQPHPLIWSTNSSGYTPVDLEWIRHIEAGNGFFSHRSFYPLDTRGIRRPEARCDALYGVLLRQAVDQVLAGQQSPPSSFATTINTSEGTTTTTTTNSATGAADTQTDSSPRTVVGDPNDGPIGLLLHRILLVVRASFGDSFSRSPFDLSGDILHQAAALCGPNGPVLPRPVLELILWQHPDQIERQDHAGKLPLHYAVRLCRSHEDASVKSLHEWKLWIQKLLHVGPEACRVKDNRGRLPLHYALDYPLSRSIVVKTATTAPVQEVRNTVLRKLVNQFPQSVELADPVTKLYPFQLAAMNPLVSLDTLYVLLRMCPGTVSHCMLRSDA